MQWQPAWIAGNRHSGNESWRRGGGQLHRRPKDDDAHRKQRQSLHPHEGPAHSSYRPGLRNGAPYARIALSEHQLQQVGIPHVARLRLITQGRRQSAAVPSMKCHDRFRLFQRQTGRIGDGFLGGASPRQLDGAAGSNLSANIIREPHHVAAERFQGRFAFIGNLNKPVTDFGKFATAFQLHFNQLLLLVEAFLKTGQPCSQPCPKKRKLDPYPNRDNKKEQKKKELRAQELIGFKHPASPGALTCPFNGYRSPTSALRIWSSKSRDQASLALAFASRSLTADRLSASLARISGSGSFCPNISLSAGRAASISSPISEFTARKLFGSCTQSFALSIN
uniref:Uncharacterized protein n=1 Tax=uncultured bacterium BAC17H8 TaxID=332980 RepID=Q4JMN2_9BACT|nr:unknown [uncultured bacterium BAC17H8]